VSYGAAYWLEPMERYVLQAMQFCRVELRMAANFLTTLDMLESVYPPIFDAPESAFDNVGGMYTYLRNTARYLVRHSETLFASCAARLDTLETEHHAALSGDERVFNQTYGPFKQYGRGYYAHYWIQAPPAVRVDAAHRLSLYDPPFLPAVLLDGSWEAKETLNALRFSLYAFHAADQNTFMALALQFANPPYTRDHAQACIDKLHHYGDLDAAFGTSHDFPW